MSTTSSARWIGLDIGGSRVKGGVLDAAGNVVGKDVEPTIPGQGTKALEGQLDALIARLIARSDGHLAGIGLSMTGPVDPARGTVHLPGKIKGLARHPTVPYVRERWGVPVTADNDGRMATYGEWKAGAGKGVENLVVITLGTGIGSGVVMEGRMLMDAHLLRGTQVGHMVIQHGGTRCLTGPQGTGESMASVTALVQDVRSAVARGLPIELPEGVTAATLTFIDVVFCLEAGDAIVQTIFQDWLDRFAMVLLNAYYAYVPDLIVLSGGPMRAASLFMVPLRQRLNQLAFRVPVGYPIKVKEARLGEDAGWIGAALRVHEQDQP